MPDSGVVRGLPSLTTCDGGLQAAVGALPRRNWRSPSVFCKFKDLDNLVSAIGRRKPWPARTSCYFLPGHDLSPETLNWLDLCVAARTKAEGALA